MFMNYNRIICSEVLEGYHSIESLKYERISIDYNHSANVLQTNSNNITPQTQSFISLRHLHSHFPLIRQVIPNYYHTYNTNNIFSVQLQLWSSHFTTNSLLLTNTNSQTSETQQNSNTHPNECTYNVRGVWSSLKSFAFQNVLPKFLSYFPSQTNHSNAFHSMDAEDMRAQLNGIEHISN